MSLAGSEDEEDTPKAAAGKAKAGAKAPEKKKKLRNELSTAVKDKFEQSGIFDMIDAV